MPRDGAEADAEAVPRDGTEADAEAVPRDGTVQKTSGQAGILCFSMTESKA